MSDQHRVSVIIVTHNSLPALDDALGSLKKGLEKISGWQVIIVDNASSDEWQSCVRRHFPQAETIANRKNRGFAAACNLGAKIAGGEFLLFHNPDVQIDGDCIANLMATFEESPRAGAVVGRMRFEDGRFQATCRNFPTIRNLLFSRGSVLSFLWRDTSEYTLGDYSELTEVPVVSGTLMMIRRDVFFSQAGFDERFFMYMEDTDLCLRLRQAGLRNYFVPSAGGIHLWGRGSQKGKTARQYYHHVSVWKFFVKHFPNGVSLLILPVILAVNLVLTWLLPPPSARSRG
ncbi:MAG: glycosyltransferase family 2 protein [Candidatus Zixiibacteriota bacterium]|nr:MAG: glycosyltransferase family 2 protein [candidate division Zixibacteria bacterium]